MDENKDLAPNPFWGYCTLALDQELIRKLAEIGDWVIGLSKIATSEGNEEFKLVFAMHITEKLTIKEFWENPRFQKKKPDLEKEEFIYHVGDNIYKPTDTGFEQIPSLHSREFFESEKKNGNIRKELTYMENTF